MDHPSPALVLPISAALPDTRLHGATLMVARVVWVTFFALNLIWFGLAIGPQVATTLHPCVAQTCALTPAQAALLHHHGIGLVTVAVYHIGMPALIVVGSFIVAALLFWRRSDDWLALGAQAVTELLSGQAEPAIVLVVSTLGVAALVNPLRHRLQALVDRRFYRSKYDAARTLEAFGETLRTKTDVGELSKQLVTVVQETMQPATVSLWLREARTTPTDERAGGSDG
jgi:hypothetical protein